MGFESKKVPLTCLNLIAQTDLLMVGAVGLEPTILSAADFKSAAYANSATPP